MTKKPIQVTENYAIKSDGNRCITVYERRTVDPTKAPGWKKRVADVKAEGKSAPDPTPHEKWAELNSYHGNLASALQAIIDRTVIVSEAETLTELLTEVKAVKEEIVRAYEIRLTDGELATFRAD